MEAFISQMIAYVLENNLFSFALMLLAIWWFIKRDEKKEETIKGLHEENKELLKLAIDGLNNSATSIDKLTDRMNRNG